MRNLSFSWFANISLAVKNGQPRDTCSIGGKPQNEDNQTNNPTQNARIITHTPPKHRR
jgi:hypothetical protein